MAREVLAIRTWLMWCVFMGSFAICLHFLSPPLPQVALILLQFLNVFVGFFEELKADEAIEALKKSLLPMVTMML